METSNVQSKVHTDQTSEEKSYVLEKELRWRRRRETWMPIITVVISVFVLFIIAAQALIYHQQRQIMARQVQNAEDSQRALVSVASITVNFAKGEIVLLLENSGRVKAMNLKVEAKEYRQTNIVVGSKTKFDAGWVSLFPGSFKMRVIVVMSKFKPEEVEAIQKKAESLVVTGKIQYQDRFGPAEEFFAFEYTPPNNADWVAMSNSPNDIEPSLELRAYNISHDRGLTVVTAVIPEVRTEIGKGMYTPTPNHLWTPLSNPFDVNRSRVGPSPNATLTPAATPIISLLGKSPSPVPYLSRTPTATPVISKRQDRAGIGGGSCSCGCKMVCDNRCEFECTNCSLTAQIAMAQSCCDAAHEATGDLGPCQQDTPGSKRKKGPG
ncbi:MAG: hypothetical protein ACXW18_04745 [Pyrinomonadaceae bacterium]